VPIPATILVVDDQELVRRTLRSLLELRSQWKVYEAENGRVALNRTREIQPDVVVLDVVMPEMNGMEAAYRIRQLNPAPKIIFMSSHYVPEELVTIARIFGDGDFIDKSETGKALVPAISRLLPEECQAKTITA
jgi:CheY-like chemotaxis protein